MDVGAILVLWLVLTMLGVMAAALLFCGMLGVAAVGWVVYVGIKWIYRSLRESAAAGQEL